MNTQYQTINWNGQTLEISLTQDSVTSRLAGEQHVALKVISSGNAKPLIHDTFAAAVIRSAGGMADFVDVMLSGQYAA